MGADLVDLLPESDAELIPHLGRMFETLEYESSFNKNLYNVFKLSIAEFFSKMVRLSAEHVTTYHTYTRFFPGEILGYVKLIGDPKGEVLITCAEDFAAKMISSVMGVPVDQISEKIVLDGMGEITNIITGAVKSRLSYSNIHFLIDFPKSIKGRENIVEKIQPYHHVNFVYKIGEDSFAVHVKLSSFIEN
jgi:CheY-specific phosphatase CheX